MTYTIGHGGTDAEQILISKLASETQIVLDSPAFRRNLLSLKKRHPTAFVRRGRPDLPLDRVADIFAGTRATARYSSARLVLIGNDDPESEDCQRAGSGRPLLIGGSVPIRFGHGIIADYRSADLVQRSCAINTIAHEFSHAVSLTPVVFTRAFEDTRPGEAEIPGRSDSNSAVGSYLIGSVAQCTWLESVGRIPRGGFLDCVQVFGVRSFNWRRCTAFSGRRPVQLDIGMPAPNRPL